MNSKALYLLGATPEEVAALMEKHAQPLFRKQQLDDWVWNKRVATFDDMLNLPGDLRKTLPESAYLRSLHMVEHLISHDELTEKWLLTTADGYGIETVLIREQKGKRNTACISCSIGCPLNCRFCASARGKFIRHLKAGEIIEQVLQVEQLSGSRVTNVVFMGTGEPFLNYDEVLAAARRINSSPGLGIGARHITVSTVGVIPGIERFSTESEEFRLAISFHAPDQETRKKIIPSAEKWRMDRILFALRRYWHVTRRKVTLEYLLIDGFNASRKNAMRLCELLQDIPCKINCIPFNPVKGYTWQPPEMKTCREFISIINNNGIRATLRTEKGCDIGAACGQLRARHIISG